MFNSTIGPREVVRTAREIDDHVVTVRYKGIRCLFLSKETRDAVAAKMKAMGLRVKKGTSRSQTMHPEYITDFVGTYETGFGNTDYQRHWPILYSLGMEESR